MKLPWVKWFPTDWLSDAELSKTSLLGRGLWIEALNAMFNSDTFTLEGSPEELSRVLRCSVAEFNTALSDLALHNAAVLERRNGHVTLISRRLQRLYKERENGRLRKQLQRDRHKRHAIVPSAYASVSFSSPKGNGGVGERGVELPSGFPATPDDAIAQCQVIGADTAFVTTLWNGAMARSGQDALGQAIRSWPHYVAKHWPKEQAKRFESQQDSSKPDFWKNSRELELVEKEIKSVKGRATQTSTGSLIQPKDKPNFERLKTRRDELKKMLGLW